MNDPDLHPGMGIDVKDSFVIAWLFVTPAVYDDGIMHACK